MKPLTKLKRGDKVAILSPSSAAPGKWPHVYQLGLKRLQEEFGLVPVAFPSTAKVGASVEERAADLIAAFEDSSIIGVISSIGGDDQVTYIHNLPAKPFVTNPKPFFGFSDNSHFANFLWLNGVPSFYGGALFTQFAMQGKMDDYTNKYLEYALFERGEYELTPSQEYNDIGLSWEDESTLSTRRIYEKSDGWHWDGNSNATGVLWGGCLESVGAMLEHNIPIPSLEQFGGVVLMLETSEEIPSAEYVFSIFQALGERGILEQVQGVLMGRAKAWEFDKPNTPDQKTEYRRKQQETVLRAVRKYSTEIPIIQNMNFGHTDPQIPMPYGSMVRIDCLNKSIFAHF